jgi:uroporphyrin-III C-methyltransferase/precorrin-2 dehydrogenase/sirohydrochlorin ferrochelatase
MDYLPIFLDLRGRDALVVGGGPVALRKIELLLLAGAQVRVVAPALCPPLRTRVARAKLRVDPRPYRRGDLRAVSIVIAATDSAKVNARVAADARARSIPVNVVDKPALCSFIMPAIVDRGPVVVALSTSGTSPVLARLMRARLEAMLPSSLGDVARFAERHRARVKRRFSDVAERRAFWEQVLDGKIADLVLAGQLARANVEMRKALTRSSAQRGVRVALIGAGDGDSDRVSLAAARWLGRAELIVHDRRASGVVRALGRRDAERVVFRPAGAGRDRAWKSLIEAAIGHRIVCFVRSGEAAASSKSPEALHLRKSGIRFALLPPAPPSR